jgi:hypothetical protein
MFDQPEAEVLVVNNGATWSFTPVSQEAKDWFGCEVHGEGCRWEGSALIVDADLTDDLIARLFVCAFIVEVT